MQPSSNQNPNHRFSTRPSPPFSPSKPFTLSSRPFIIQTRIPNPSPVNIPPLNLQINQLNSLTHLNSLPRPHQRPPPPDVKCQFCNESFKSEEITGHMMECEMQRISCERCGDRVPMEVYDIHYEECGGANGNNRMETVELRSPMERRRGNEIEEDEDDDDMSADEMYLPENAMSYEQLLRLDEEVVKKGMSEEEMKGFKVQLYVKSLDGEGSCCVCISEFETAEYTRELPCHHKFHKDCIDKWLERSIVCPTCKKYLR